MKNKIFRHLWMIVVVSLVSCTTEVDFQEEIFTPSEIENIRVVARDFEGAENLSRTMVEIGTTGASFAWAANDTIGIFPNSGYQVAFPMISGAGSQTASFDGGGWALKASATYSAYYPFNYDYRSPQNILVDYMGQKQVGDGSTDHLGAYDYMLATPVAPQAGNVTFEFKHISSLVQFKLKVPEAGTLTSLTLNASKPAFVRRGKVNLTTGNVMIIPEAESPSFSMELEDIQVSANQEVTIYTMMAPVDLTGLDVTVAVTNNEGEVTTGTLDAIHFEAGKAYALSSTLSAFEEAEIQNADIRGKVLTAAGGELQLDYLTNTECELIIPEEAKTWIQPITSRALSAKTKYISVAENTSESNRRATLQIKCKDSNLAVEYGIVQAGIHSYAITEANENLPIGVLSTGYPVENSEHGFDKLFDNDLNTYFEISRSNFNIVWESPIEMAFDEFTFGVASIGSSHPSGASIGYSNDGENWSGIGWGFVVGNENYAYILPFSDTKARGKFMRLQIDGNHGGTTTQISEFSMNIDVDAYDDITSLEDVLQRASSFTQSSSTPMGKHYENKHVTTDADRAWLTDATNEPALLESASHYTLRPYTVELYPYGTPVPADVNQHGIGDCSALAVFAEMAYLFPGFIQSIIEDHGDGTFTVAMYDPQGNPVDVTIQSTFLGDNNGMGACTGKKGQPTWASVLEKAIMKWNYIYQVNPDISGIGSEHVAPLFTGEGNSFAFPPTALLTYQMKQVVEIVHDNRFIVIGGFNKGGLAVDGGPQTVTAHAYSFFQSADPNALFAMRNPWGNSPGGAKTDDGVMNIQDDGIIPQTIDLRIIYPGAALEYAVKEISPYIPPQY